MKKSLNLILFLVIPFLHLSSSGSVATPEPMPEATLYQVIDIPFQVRLPKNTDPFLLKFGALFTGPQGQTQKVRGFYNGDGEFVLRFSASLPGMWSYTTNSDLKKLDGKSGSLKVLARAEEGKHGGIVIPENNPQRFEYEHLPGR
jgi:hypothetical protein